MSVYPITGDVNFDHIIMVESVRFPHCIFFRMQLRSGLLSDTLER